MGFYEEVGVGYPTNRILQHGWGPSKLHEKLRADDPLFPLAISRPTSNNGSPDNNDHKSADRER